MDINITAAERREIAAQVGVDEAYLYQCLTGRKGMKVHEAVRVERDSGMRIRRWHLRSNDWWRNWPELIGAPGAPKVPKATAREGQA